MDMLKLPAENKNGPHKIYIATPAYGGQVYVSYMTSIFNSIMALQEMGANVVLGMQTHESLITRGRNRAARDFLASDCTHLLFIDADIGFPKDAISRLLLRNEAIVGALYPKKKIDWEKVTMAADRGIRPLQAFTSDYVVNTKDGKVDLTNNGLVEVQDLGTGFMLIKRSVFETLVNNMPELMYMPTGDDNTGHPCYNFFHAGVDPVSRVYLSEDYWFCRIAQRQGFKTYADLNIDLTHTGSYVFEGNMKNHLAGLAALQNPETVPTLETPGADGTKPPTV